MKVSADVMELLLAGQLKMCCNNCFYCRGLGICFVYRGVVWSWPILDYSGGEPRYTPFSASDYLDRAMRCWLEGNEQYFVHFIHRATSVLEEKWEIEHGAVC